MPFASAQAVLQCFFPAVGVQLQAGWAHLVVDFMCLLSPSVDFFRRAREAENHSHRIQ
jgi:hypothetical protein